MGYAHLPLRNKEYILRWDEFIQGQINSEGFFLLGVGVCGGVQHLKEMSTRVKDSNSIKMLKEYLIMIYSDKMRKWEKIYSPQSPIK